jgi:hypothetical protein
VDYVTFYRWNLGVHLSGIPQLQPDWDLYQEDLSDERAT